MSILTTLLGNNGTGKTFLLSYFSTFFNKNVYSNFKLDINNYIPLEIHDLIEMDNFQEGNIFLDEAYTWIESRTSGNVMNLLTSYLIFQKRKRNLDIYLTAQLFSSVDKRARELSNIIITCLPRYNDTDDFNYTYFDLDINRHFSFTIPYYIAKEYFYIFDTNEIIELPNKSKFGYDVLKNNKRKLLERSMEIAYIINPELTKLTHNKISYLLLQNNFDDRFEKTIYLYLKEGGIS